MVGLIVDLKPLRIKELEKKFQKDRDIANKKIRITRKINNQIQQNPIKRDKFQID